MGSIVLLVACLATRGQGGALSTKLQQSALLDQAGSYYYVVKYASIDIDSAIIVASKSLGISLLPIITEAIPERISTALSNWVGKDNPSEGKSQLPALKGMAHLQQLFLLGSWYAFQSLAHPDLMDSATTYLAKTRAEAKLLNADLWSRRSACLLGKAFLGKNDTVSGNAWFNQTIAACRQAADLQGEALAWKYWSVYFPLLPGAAAGRIEHLKKAETLYRIQMDDYHLFNVLIHIGYQDYYSVHFEEAKSKFGEALQLEDSIQWPYTHYTTDLLALVGHVSGRFDNALRYALRSIKSSEQTRDSLCWSTFYIRLGDAYSGSDLFQNEFIFWYKKAIDRLMLSGGELQMYQYAAALCGALGNIHRENEIPPLVEQLRRRYPPANVVDSLYDHFLQWQYAICTQDTASELKYALLAAPEAKRAEAIRPYMHGLGAVMLGTAWFHHGNYKQAEPLLRAYVSNPAPMEEWATGSSLVDIYRQLLKIDTATGKVAAAASDYHVFWILDSAAYSAAQARQVDILKVQYEVGEKEQSIRLLQSDSERQRALLEKASLARKIEFGGIIVLLILAGCAYYAYYTKRRNVNRLLAQQNEINEKNLTLEQLLGEKNELIVEKNLLLQEVHHRVKNNLHTVMSLLESQSVYLSDKGARSALLDSQNRIQTISLLHQKLYWNSNVTSLEMAPYIAEMCAFLASSLGARERRIEITQFVDPILLDISVGLPIGLLLNEAITNALKHAFPDNTDQHAARTGHIEVAMRQLDDGVLLLQIADDGIGMSPGAGSASNSLGMTLMKSISEKLEGHFSVHGSDKGVRVTLEFRPGLFSSRENPTLS